MENTFQMVAKTFQGLEDVLRDELIALGAQNVETGVRMVEFEGDLELLYKANLCCRTALRVLKPIVKFNAVDPDELYDFVRDMKWEEYMTVDSTFAIDATVNSALFTHSKYAAYRVKDAIVDHFNDLCGRRPSIRLSGADLLLNVHIQEDRVTISLDSSGEPLSRRGYRVEQTEAPINEVLAAGIIMKTGWHGECDFADPMCGSGTFLIEAALIAGNINPGIYREGFAFEKWSDFDADLFESIYNDDSAEREITCEILGGDIDPEAVTIARKNINAARLDSNISLVCRPMQDWDENERNGGILITNPPYGERLRPADMETLYRQIGETLKKHFQGWHAWILGYRDEHFAAIGLRPSVKFPILNGALECSLREYVLFDGAYNDFRANGGSVRNTEFTPPPPPTQPHQSDAERDADTRPSRKKQRRRQARGTDRRDERKPMKSKGSDDRRDFKRRNDRSDDRRDFKRRDDRKFDKPQRGEARVITDRAPRLGEEYITFSSSVKMRTRKPWKKRASEAEEED